MHLSNWTWYWHKDVRLPIHVMSAWEFLLCFSILTSIGQNQVIVLHDLIANDELEMWKETLVVCLLGAVA